MSNLAANERTSFVDWGCGMSPIRVTPKADWAHISYLDISRAAIVGPNRPVVSADLCLSDPSPQNLRHLRECLGNVDFLFVSATEVAAYFPGKSASQAVKELCLLGVKAVIFHERHQTLVANAERMAVIPNPVGALEGIDVLGAGDIYCASFIRCMIEGSGPEVAANDAHERTFEILKRRNEDEKI
jgi:sugar/nucleoside kinase (ribokinase family)